MASGWRRRTARRVHGLDGRRPWSLRPLTASGPVAQTAIVKGGHGLAGIEARLGLVVWSLEARRSVTSAWGRPPGPGASSGFHPHSSHGRATARDGRQRPVATRKTPDTTLGRRSRSRCRPPAEQRGTPTRTVLRPSRHRLAVTTHAPAFSITRCPGADRPARFTQPSALVQAGAVDEGVWSTCAGVPRS